MKIDNDKVYAIVDPDNFVRIIIAMVGDHTLYRYDSQWENLEVEQENYYLKDTTAKQVDPDAVEDLLDIIDEDNNTNPETGVEYSVESLEEFWL